MNDLEERLKKAEKLGGKVVMQPMKVNDHLTVAGFIDPAGNFFGLYNGM
ncbi:MAG: hypothetical protein LC663_00655 [Actinobacteria bacterium]|nr:hypothetical protein [Actinomycetota bacterium]